MPLRAAGNLLAGLRAPRLRQETVPAGFLDLPAARRYALDPYLTHVAGQRPLIMPRLRPIRVCSFVRLFLDETPGAAQAS